MIDDVVFTFDSVYQYDVVNFSASNIDCSLDTSGELSFGIYPAAINTNAPPISTTNPAQLHIFADPSGTNNYNIYKTVTSPDEFKNTFTIPGTYYYGVTLEDGVTNCPIVSETSSFTIEDVNNAQLNVSAIDVVQPDCVLSEISLTIENEISPLEIRWYEFIVTTITAEDDEGRTINATTTSAWTPKNQYDDQATVSGIPPGTYRAIITDGREFCSGGEFITRNIVIQNSGKPYDVQVYSSFIPQCPEDLVTGGV